MESTPKKRKQAKPRELRQFADPYLTRDDVGDLLGGRSGRRPHPNTMRNMVKDGRLPPPDLFGRWRQSRLLKHLRKFERKV